MISVRCTLNAETPRKHISPKTEEFVLMLSNKYLMVNGLIILFWLIGMAPVSLAQLTVSTTGDDYTFKGQSKPISSSSTPAPMTIPGKLTQGKLGFSSRWAPVYRNGKPIIYIDSQTVQKDVNQYWSQGIAPIDFRFWARHPEDVNNISPLQAKAECQTRTLSINGQGSQVAPDTDAELIWGYFCNSQSAKQVVDNSIRLHNDKVIAQRKEQNELNDMAKRAQRQNSINRASGVLGGLLSVPALYGW